MILNNIYFPIPAPPKPSQLTFHNAFLDASECDKIMSLADNVEPYVATVQNEEPGSSRIDKEIRDVDSYGVWHSPDTDWIFKKIFEQVMVDNETNFHFDIAGIFSGLSLLRYQQEQHYEWHNDIGSGDTSTRKLSVVIMLSENFTGGDLVLTQGVSQHIAMRQGNMVVFPSYVLHKVTPVEEGDRWSLVAWIQGIKPFR